MSGIVGTQVLQLRSSRSYYETLRMLKIVVIVVLTAAGLYGLHRLALWMEGRGWIYYKTSGSSTARTNAFLSFQSILEPGKQHVLEERLRQQDDADGAESGAPPGPEDDDNR
jgi:hypothetical protein